MQNHLLVRIFMLTAVLVSGLLSSCAGLRYDCSRDPSGNEVCSCETTGTLSFSEKNGKEICAVRPQGELPGSSVEWPSNAVPIAQVDTQKVYRLQYLFSRTGNHAKARDWYDVELHRIIDEDRILYDASICPLHQVAMTWQEESVRDVDSEEYRRYSRSYGQKHFPHHGKVYLACGSGIRHMLWQCPTCHRLSEQ